MLPRATLSPGGRPVPTDCLTVLRRAHCAHSEKDGSRSQPRGSARSACLRPHCIGGILRPMSALYRRMGVCFRPVSGSALANPSPALWPSAGPEHIISLSSASGKAALRSVWVDRGHPRNARYSSTARVGALLHRPTMLPMGLSMGRWWLSPGQDAPRRLSSSWPCQRRPASSGPAHP